MSHPSLQNSLNSVSALGWVSQNDDMDFDQVQVFELSHKYSIKCPGWTSGHPHHLHTRTRQLRLPHAMSILQVGGTWDTLI